MSYPDYMKSVYAACKQEGWMFHSTDRFVRQALEHLAGRQAIEISGSDADGWNVCIEQSDFGPLSVGGYTLAEALAGAVLAKPEQPEPVCCCGRTSYGSCPRCGQIMERAQRAAGEGRDCTVAEVLVGEKTESSTVPAKGRKSRKRLARPIWRRATV